MNYAALCLTLLIAVSQPLNAAIRETDSAGREVVLDQPAQRIIALTPHIVENTFSAGAGDRLVGVVSYSDYPSAALKLPQVGSFQAWSLESIIALRPDLVLVWGSASGMEKVAALERMGITTYLNEPRRLADIPATIRAIGRLAGTTATADAEADRMEAELSRLRARHRSIAPLRVFYQVWNQPLQTVNGEHLISDIITLCGGHNIFAAEPILAPRVNIESILARDPQVIIASGTGAGRPTWLDDWLAYPSLSAVRDKALFFIHPDLIQRPTARIVQGARQLCRQLDGGRDPEAQQSGEVTAPGYLPEQIAPAHRARVEE